MNRVPTTATAPSTPAIGASPTALHPDVEMQARVQQDTARIMAAITDPAAAFQALAAEYDLQVVEWDARGLDESLRDKLLGHYLEHKDGRRIFVVRVGQDPDERLHALRALLAHQEVTPV